VLWRSEPQVFTLDAPGLACYRVVDGRFVQAEPADGVGHDVARLLAHGLPRAARWVQRRYLVLHASAVVTPLGAVAFAGPSGMGKSVLAVALARRGAPLLSDEVLPVALAPGGGLPRALPLQAEALLWGRAARQLGLDPEALEPARPGLARYWVPAPMAPAPQPLARVYCLGLHNQPEVKVETLGGQARVLSLLRAAFNRVLAEPLEERRQMLLRLAALPRELRVARLLRPEAGWSLDALLAALEQDGAL
jgi:hypothetical protein